MSLIKIIKYKINHLAYLLYPNQSEIYTWLDNLFSI